MMAAEKWQEVIAHNLANASTTGFKREILAFDEGFLRSMVSAEGKYIGELGAGPVLAGSQLDLEVGAALTTGNPLDVAIRTREGMFAVETPQGVKYTRDGSFSLNSNREIVTKLGMPILDDRGSRIQIPEEKTPRINEKGEVVAGDEVVGKLGIFQGKFVRFGDGLFDAGNATAMENVAVISGAVESSNVNAVEEMINMIKLNRAFEMAQKSAASQDESTDKLIQSATR